MASWLESYGNATALSVANELDAKVEALLVGGRTMNEAPVLSLPAPLRRAITPLWRGRYVVCRLIRHLKPAGSSPAVH
jgi:hypothetical protein